MHREKNVSISIFISDKKKTFFFFKLLNYNKNKLIQLILSFFTGNDRK